MADVKDLVKYTLPQVREHSKSSDLWVIIDDQVYDLTNFLSEHPGGAQVLEEVAGKDATKAFNDIGHSRDAITQMKRYYIGEFVEEQGNTKEVHNDDSFMLCSALGPIGVAGALLYRGITRSYSYFRFK